ncbi:unnamed protein product [Meganyctiphanes norvegica]|uniref:Phosphatidic acid phosphatase type 2/haloperoxidase domain-containing protein n=1 Tax=Meganyctiphanes norvegica TaxID=48144 RepID=A0AAV2Q3U5_MEGNR
MVQSLGCATILKTLNGWEFNSSIKVLLEVLILLLVGLPILLLATIGSPRQRGFYCSDDTLFYPLLPSTISNNVLIIGGTFIPIVTMLIIEIFKDSPGNDTEDGFCKRCSPSKMKAIAPMIGYFIFGCGCILALTLVVKYNIGGLRPHFHAACQTDWNSIKANCSETLHPVYIHTIPCLNQDQHVLDEARLSFFSGHASFSAFTMIYLIFYLEDRFTWHHPALLKPFIQFLCLLITVYISISRVFDYHHHWSDVLFGFLVGGIMAYLISKYVSGLLKGRRTREMKAVKVDKVDPV